MSGYTRQSSANMISGNTIYASDFNNEFNAVQSAFDGNTGHTHDGTTGNGPKINLTTSIVGVLQAANGGNGGINNTSATSAPTTSSDSSVGYRAGSIWIDTTNNIMYICVDDAVASAIWVRYQVYSTALTSIAGLTTSANQMIYTTGSNLYATTSLTPFARTILDDVDASTTRTTLGLGSIATQNANAVSITGGNITGITDLAIADGGTGASDASGARANLGLGSMSLQNSSFVNISGGNILGITDLAIADGGTGASTVSDARANLGLGSLSTLNTINDSNWSGTDLAITNGGTGASDSAGARANLGLGNVDNTSDLNKPVSTAQQAALNLKANTADLGTMSTQNANSVNITGGSIANTVLSSGAIIDRAYAEYALNTSFTSQIPLDDTIPQITEGTQILSVTITPKSTTSRLRIRTIVFGATLVQSSMNVAVFSDLSTNALAAGYVVTDAANYEREVVVEYEWVPGSTATRTISVRVGPGTGTTMYTNGNSSGRVFGGVMRSSLVVEEIKG